MRFLIIFACLLLVYEAHSLSSMTCPEKFHWDEELKICQTCGATATYNPSLKLCVDPSHRSEKCKAGFQYDLEQKKCLDINECGIDYSLCQKYEICRNLEGSYKCKEIDYCGQGYKYNKITQECEDVDECDGSYDYCDTTKYVCENVRGSFNCREPCPPNKKYHYNYECHICEEGFYWNTTSSQCEDYDECDKPFRLQCAPYKEICVKKPKISECVTHCSGGTKTVNGECVDIDECALNIHNCTITQRCYNDFGTFSCSEIHCNDNTQLNLITRDCDCKPGFKLNPYTERCIDLDECDGLIPVCGEQGKCVNEAGHYTCICDQGFAMQNGTCRDIDECANTADICGHLQCKNTPGHFQCGCPTGYRKNTNNTCDDIDECLENSDICRNDISPLSKRHNCFNLVGSYRCITAECPAEYRLVKGTGASKQCELMKAHCSHFANKDCLEILPEKLKFKGIEIRKIKSLPYVIGTIKFNEEPFNHYYAKVSYKKSMNIENEVDVTDIIQLRRSKNNKSLIVNIVKQLSDSTEMLVDIDIKVNHNGLEKFYYQIQYQLFVNYAHR